MCKAKPQRLKNPPHRAFLWKKADFKAISDEVNKIDFTTICLPFNPEDVGSTWSIFHSTLMESRRKNVPSNITSSKPAKPWINTQLKRRKKGGKSDGSVEKHADLVQIKHGLSSKDSVGLSIGI